MNIDQIRYFMEIEKYKSFSVAAQHLHMNQSTVSRQIADLEKEFGADLFIRSTRSIDLTEAGRIFLKEGNEILARVDKLYDKIGHMGKGSSGRLVIGLPVNIFGTSAEISVLDIAEEYPEADFKYIVMDLEELNTALVCGDIDIGFTYEFAINEIREEIVFKSIFKKPFVFFASKKSTLCNQESINLKEIISRRLVLLKTDYQPRFLASIISKAAFDGANRILFCINCESMLMEVASSGGVGVLPEVIFEREKDIYKINRLNIDGVDNDISYIIAHNKKNKNPLINSFYKSCIKNKIFR